MAPAGGKLRIEARIQMPNVTPTNGLGYWPAFWALGGQFRQNRTNWPAVGEIDIMENVNAGSTVNHGLHCVCFFECTLSFAIQPTHSN